MVPHYGRWDDRLLPAYREPFSYLRANAYGLTSPTAEICLGLFLVVAGVVMSVYAWPHAVVLIVTVLFVGLGVFAAVVGFRRLRWARRVHRVAGKSPFALDAANEPIPSACYPVSGS